MNSYIAVNSYRSSTSHGFNNAWVVVAVEDRKLQSKVLREGLPVDDVTNCDYSPIYSTMGIRACTSAELKAAKRFWKRSYYGPLWRIVWNDEVGGGYHLEENI